MEQSGRVGCWPNPVAQNPLQLGFKNRVEGKISTQTRVYRRRATKEMSKGESEDWMMSGASLLEEKSRGRRRIGMRQTASVMSFGGIEAVGGGSHSQFGSDADEA